MTASGRPLRLGVAGLGRAFTIMLPTFVQDPRVRLVAAADPRAEAGAQFARDFGGKVYETVEALCADAEAEAIYVASPHELHADHVCAAAAAGKHVLVEKPMAITMEDGRRMIAAARRADVRLIVGHSHSFNAPVLRARELIESGEFGPVRMISALNYTDFLYRPRRPEELDTERGGGVVFSQAAHQVDIVRLLGGGRVKSVRASAGMWDPARPTEGAYAASLTFEGGAFATLIYSGYARFDSDEYAGWIGEMGSPKNPEEYGAARAALARAADAGEEARLKNARNYGAPGFDFNAAVQKKKQLHQHFGEVLVSCDRADLRPTPAGVMIYGDRERRLDALPVPAIPRSEVIDELYDVVVNGSPPLHGGEWGLATLEVCLAILRASHEQREVTLEQQVGAGPVSRRRP